MEWDHSQCEVVVFPTMVHINYVNEMVDDHVSIGVQNVSKHKQGAFTGEISAEAVKDFGVNWALVGHSERRVLFGETNSIVA